jgi:hypothetical protein
MIARLVFEQLSPVAGMKDAASRDFAEDRTATRRSRAHRNLRGPGQFSLRHIRIALEHLGCGGPACARNRPGKKSLPDGSRLRSLRLVQSERGGCRKCGSAR